MRLLTSTPRAVYVELEKEWGLLFWMDHPLLTLDIMELHATYLSAQKKLA